MRERAMECLLLEVRERGVRCLPTDYLGNEEVRQVLVQFDDGLVERSRGSIRSLDRAIAT